MRFLLIDTRYPESMRKWYGAHPGLEHMSYQEQMDSVSSSMIGETAAQASALRTLGHEASDVVANLWPAQAAWFRERTASKIQRASLGLLSGNIRWRQHMLGRILLAQIEANKPDVVHLAAPDVLDVGLIREIRSRSKFLLAQTAARLAPDRWDLGYDLVVSSLPRFVERFRGLGVASEWLPLAFNAEAYDAMPPTSRDLEVTFVGSLLPVHDERVRVLSRLSSERLVEIWAAQEKPSGLPANARLHPPVWGSEMLRVLARSRQTINVHGRTEASPPTDANNYRLFEATGMGALLVTDRLQTLADLFVIGREVVAFGSPEECVEIVDYYQRHPDEAEVIAAAGRARTRRDHTWLDRMAREVDFIRMRRQ